MDLPKKISVYARPAGEEDRKPYVAIVVGDAFRYAAEGDTPSEALLLVAAHWHSRAHIQS